MNPTLDQLIDEAAATVARINAICEHAEGIIAKLQQSMPEPREEAPPVPESLQMLQHVSQFGNDLTTEDLAKIDALIASATGKESS